MLSGILLLLPVLVVPTAVSDQPAFLQAWASSDYTLACAHLDGLSVPLVGTDVLDTAAKARQRCGTDALAKGALAEAEHQLKALENLGADAAISEALAAAIRGWRSLGAARDKQLGRALSDASNLELAHWPKGLDTALLRLGKEALRRRELRQAKATLVLLESQAPATFGLKDLRQDIWWATEGGRIAFRVALISFLLLLALTARSLLRTRRRAKALLQAESQT